MPHRDHLDEGTIHAWLDGALGADEARDVEAHVADCAECAAAVAEARGLIAASSRILAKLDAVPGGVLPRPAAPPVTAAAAADDAAAATPVVPIDRARRSAPPTPRRWWRSLPIRAAAALLLVATGTVVVVRERGTDQRAGPASEFGLAVDRVGKMSREARTTSQDVTLQSGAARPASPTASDTAAMDAADGAPARPREQAATATAPTTGRSAVAESPSRRQVTTAGAPAAVPPAAPLPTPAPPAAILAEPAREERLARSGAFGAVADASAERARAVRRDAPAAQSALGAAAAPAPSANAAKAAAPAAAPMPPVADAGTGLVTGTVRSEGGNPVEGASVFLQGLNKGTQTDRSGHFAIAGVPPGRQTLVVRSIGYAPVTREVTTVADSAAVVHATLRTNALALSEVVVTGADTERAGSESLPQRVAGCYVLRVGEWRPAPAAGTFTAAVPSRVALDAVGADVPVAAPGELALVVRERVPAASRDGAREDSRDAAVATARYAYWTPIGADSVRVVWSDGTAGVELRARLARRELRGTAATFSDDERRPIRRAPVVARRQSCDVR